MTEFRLNKSKKVIVIGSGMGGLVSSALLAQAGFEVSVYEKNDHLGGRLDYRKRDGCFIDIGPSWFMAMDQWKQIFTVLGEDIEDVLDIHNLSTGYKIFFKDTDYDPIDFPSGDLAAIKNLFESIEPGASNQLENYLRSAASNYNVAYKYFLHRPYAGLRNVFKKDLLTNLGWFDFIKTVRGEVDKRFDDSRLKIIIEWIMTFVGTPPNRTPALYTLMNYMDFVGGIHYPMGGMYEITKALVEIGEKAGVTFHTNQEIEQIIVDSFGNAAGVTFVDGSQDSADIIVSNADIEHTHRILTPEPYHAYSKTYWENRSQSPAAILYYAAIKGELPELEHHNFIFGKDPDRVFNEIYDEKIWSNDPYLYFSIPSRTDKSVVPNGQELFYLLIPVAPGLTHTNEFLVQYFDKALATIEVECKIPDLRERIIWEDNFNIDDMKSAYYAPGGAGFGMGHTLFQSAWWRPKTKHPKVNNLYLCGQSTNPGTGIANSAISGQVVYKRIMGITHPYPLTRDEVRSYES